MSEKKPSPHAHWLARVHILRLADEGKQNAEITEALDAGLPTVERTQKKYTLGGLDEALNERPPSGVQCKLSEKGEAYLIVLSCSTPTNDQMKWTVQLLTDRLVEVGIVDEISDEAARSTLKKSAGSVAEAAPEHSKCRARSSSDTWKTCWICMLSLMIPLLHEPAWMSTPIRCSTMCVSSYPYNLGRGNGWIMSISEKEPAISFCS